MRSEEERGEVRRGENAGEGRVCRELTTPASRPTRRGVGTLSVPQNGFRWRCTCCTAPHRTARDVRGNSMKCNPMRHRHA